MAAASAVIDHASWRPRYNPWLVAFTVTLATFMEVLDTSIANVALAAYRRDVRREHQLTNPPGC